MTLADAFAAATGPWAGSNGFRMTPADPFSTRPSTATLSLVAGGSLLSFAYTWSHPEDGDHEGLLVTGPGDDDGFVALWADSWHQQPAPTTMERFVRPGRRASRHGELRRGLGMAHRPCGPRRRRVRISEAIGWRWSDFDGQRLHVRRRNYLGEVDKPKSRFGVRAIPLRRATAKALWLHRKATPWSGDDDPVFASGTGSPLDYGNLYHRVMKPAMLAAGIGHGGFHRLRHTAATRLIEAGARPDQAQRWLGHHDIGFTLRTYVHPDADDLPDPDDVWDDGGERNAVEADEGAQVATLARAVPA